MAPHDKTKQARPSAFARQHSTCEMKNILRRADAVCFDVDSTVCQDEAIDDLAEYCGVGNEVKELTKRAMGGTMSFRQALAERLNVMKPKLDDVMKFIDENPFRLTEGVKELIGVLHQRNVPVYLVSGGFESIIIPVAEELNIPDENIFANRFLFNFRGSFAGFDHSALVSESGGKTRVVELLKSQFGYQNLVFIGDGATDLETYPVADAFIGFGGNVVRESIRSAAPWYVTSFQELTDVLQEKTT